ncbi:MAG TPA: tetratricopeptide repeat protein, partial [Planctomycetes bacterium]|nr:tetratricopeptide repeat protein [Planctomycetota bacterium]
IRPLLGLGVCAYLQGELERAQAILQDALNLRPDSQDGFCNLGIVYAALEKREQAYKYLGWANQPVENNARALTAAAHLMDLAGAPQEALKLIKRAVQVAPNDPYIVYTAGYLSYRYGTPEDAVPLLTKASELAPGAREALVGAAAVRLYAKDYAGAAALYRQALEWWDTADVRAGLGLALIGAGEPEKAESELSKALKLAGNADRVSRSDALNGLGYLANHRGAREEAKALFLAALSADASNDYAKQAIGKIGAQEGRFVDFYGFEDGVLPEGLKPQTNFGLMAGVENGRLRIAGIQANSDGGETLALFQVTRGAFDQGSMDVFIPEAITSEWYGGAYLIAGGVQVQVARTPGAQIAWRSKDARRGWSEWTNMGEWKAGTRRNIRIAIGSAAQRGQAARTLVISIDGRDAATLAAGQGMNATGVRFGLYASALLGASVSIEADNVVLISADTTGGKP